MTTAPERDSVSVRVCGSTLMLPIRDTPTYIRCVLAPEHDQLCRGIMADVAEFKAPDTVVTPRATVKVMLTWKAAS